MLGPTYKLMGRVESDVTVGSTLRALQAAALILLALVGSGTNSLVAIVFYRRPALRSPSNRFVLSLVLANLLTSLVVVPVLLVGTLHREMAALWWLRHASSGLTTLAVTSAIFSVLAIAVDRYNAVLSPLHYAMTITRQRSRAMIAGAWGLAGLLATPPFLGTLTSPLPIVSTHPHTPNCTIPPGTGTDGEVFRLTYVLVLVTLGFTLPLFALCWIYARMYNAAHRNSERTRRHSVSANPGEIVMSTSRQSSRGGSLDLPMPPCTPDNFRRTAWKHHHTPSLCSAMGISTGKRRCSNASFSALLYREEGRAVKTAAMVIASYLFCWTPFFATLLVDTWGAVGGVIGSPGGGSVPEPFRSLAVLAALSSGCVTPFIYVFRNEAARSEAVKVLLWWRPGVGKYSSNVARCNFESYNGKPQAAAGSVANSALHHQDNFGMRRQSLSCGDSVSVQSFHIPTAIVSSAECQHCNSEGANPHGPPGTADFVATYEVVDCPEDVKKTTTMAEISEEPQGRKMSPSASTSATGKTRRESVTFRLAFLPQRRCQSCIRQNSDSSSGSGHPLIRSIDQEDCRTPPPNTSTTVSSRVRMTVSQKRQQFMIGRQGSSGEELTAGGPSSEPDTPQHMQSTARRPEQVFLREPGGAVILELEEQGAVPRSAAVYQFQETSLEGEPRAASVEEDEAVPVVVTRQDSDNSTTVRQDSNYSDVTVDSGVVADFAPTHALVPFNRSQSSGSSISNYSLQQQQQQQPPQRPKRQRHKLQRLAAVEDEEDIVTAAPQSPTPPPRPPPPVIATDATCVNTPLRSTVKNRLKSSFKSRFYRPAFRIPKCDF